MIERKRLSYLGQFVTKIANFGGSFNPNFPSFNPRCNGVVVKEYTRKVGRNMTSFAEIKLFPSGEIQEVFRARLNLMPEDMINEKVRSSSKYWQYQRDLNIYQSTHSE